MDREINDVITSQQKMLVKMGKAKVNDYHLGLDMAFRANIVNTKKWAKKRYNIDVLTINYNDVINSFRLKSKQEGLG